MWCGKGKHIVMTDGVRILTIPRHNPVNALTMGGIVRDAGLTVEEFRKLLQNYRRCRLTRACSRQAGAGRGSAPEPHSVWPSKEALICVGAGKIACS